jgi:hypothetical protein
MHFLLTYHVLDNFVTLINGMLANEALTSHTPYTDKWSEHTFIAYHESNMSISKEITRKDSVHVNIYDWFKEILKSKKSNRSGCNCKFCHSHIIP